MELAKNVFGVRTNDGYSDKADAGNNNTHICRFVVRNMNNM